MTPRSLWLGLLVALIFHLGGCMAPVVERINPQDGLGKIAKIRAERAALPVTRVDGDITVKLVSSPSLGCVVEETSDPVKVARHGRYTCSFFNVAAGDEERTLKELLRHRGTKVGPTKVGYYVERGGAELAALLQHHLSKRFRSARVVIEPDRAGAVQVSVNPAVELYRERSSGPRRTLVTLSATTPSGAVCTGSGQGDDTYTLGHLGWAIPAMLFFPVGTMVAAISLAGIDKRTTASSIIRGLDAAAEDLAEKLARAWRSGGPAPGPRPAVPLPPSVPAAPARSEAACTKDVDCPGEELCQAGRCVSPKPTAPATVVAPAPPPPPPVTPAPPPPPALARVTSTPEGAAILVDGRELGQTPATISLEPGVHRLEIRLAGYAGFVQEIKAEPGVTAEVRATLQMTDAERRRRADEAARAAAVARRRAEAEAHYRHQLAAWEQAAAPVRGSRRKMTTVGGASTGVGAALVAAAAVAYAVGATSGTKAHDNYMAATDPDAIARYRDDIDAARRQLVAGHVLAGVGAAALGFGIVWLARRPVVPSQPAAPTFSVGAAPAAGRGVLGSVTGRF